MPVCPQCGNRFSGFSVGAQAPTLCRMCRKAGAQVPPETTAKIKAEVRAKLTWQQGPPAVTPGMTFVLIGLNAAVYVAMGLFGVSWVSPSAADAIRWGADFGPLTLSGQWWRLLTSTFVHFGIIHIGLNMWCLWDLGRSLEPWTGHKAFALMYFVCGIASSVVSVTWDPWRASAGASGAIFGVAGAFVSYLYLKKAPMDPGTMRKKLKSVGTFILYNLLYGARAGVDNSAHLGGLVAGLILGAVLPAYLDEAGVNAAPDAPAGTGISAAPTGGESNGRERHLALIAVASVAVLFGGYMHSYVSNMAAVHYGKALALLKRGDSAGGAAHLEEAVRLKPDALLAQVVLGQCRLLRSEPGLAIAPMEKALKLSPTSELIQTDLALAYLGGGKPVDAIAQATKAVAHGETENWWNSFVLGVAYDEIGNRTAAATNLRAAIRYNSEFYEAADALARVEIEQGQFDDARMLYAETRRDHPDDPVAKENDLMLEREPSGIPVLNHLATAAIPYERLVMRSPEWPLFP